MSKKVNVLGIDLSVMRAEKAVNQSFDLLKKKGMEKILFLSAAGSLYYENHEEEVPLIEKCALVLPGDAQTEAVASRHPEAVVEHADAGKFLKTYINKLFSRLNRDNMYVFAVFEQEHHLKDMKEYVTSQYPDIIFEGIVCDVENVSHPEVVVNEINAVIPDVVLIGLPVKSQATFLKDYTEMMNAKLVIFADTLYDSLKEDTQKIPLWIRFFGMNKFYLWLKKEYKLQNTIINSMFNKKVKSEDVAVEALEETKTLNYEDMTLDSFEEPDEHEGSNGDFEK